MAPTASTSKLKSGSVSVSVPPPRRHSRHEVIARVITGSTNRGRGRDHSANYHQFIRAPDREERNHVDSKGKGKGKGKGKARVNALGTEGDVIEVVEIWRALLGWFEGVHDGRGMPWRKKVDLRGMSRRDKTQRAYEIWVSEIMLQQTQVATVIAYYKRWIEAFPTVEALAEADPERVQERWKGLNYYSRATRLHKGAKTVVEEFGGGIPEEPSELEKIDGIGPYSAGAISSIAFARRSAMVDGNVTRVLSRLVALHAPATVKSTTDYIWALADLLVPSNDEPDLDNRDDLGGHNKPGAWNQALMELGATVCTPKNPKCPECPVEFTCLARAETIEARKPSKSTAEQDFDIEDLGCSLCVPLDTSQDHVVTVYPMAKERKKQREEETAVCVLEWQPSSNDGTAPGRRKVLLVKRPEKGLLAGLYEFPAVDLPVSDQASTSTSRRKALRALLKDLINQDITWEAGKSAASSSSPSSSALKVISEIALEPVTQIYSHQIRTYTAIRVVLASDQLPRLVSRGNGSNKWVDEDGVADANTGGAVGKIWDQRERVTRGRVAMTKVKKGAMAKNKDKSKAVIKKKPDANGGATLDRWMKRKRDESDQEQEQEQEQEPKKETSRTEFVPSGKYKKRVIVLSSDEDE